MLFPYFMWSTNTHPLNHLFVSEWEQPFTTSGELRPISEAGLCPPIWDAHPESMYIFLINIIHSGIPQDGIAWESCEHLCFSLHNHVYFKMLVYKKSWDELKWFFLSCSGSWGKGSLETQITNSFTASTGDCLLWQLGKLSKGMSYPKLNVQILGL